MDAGPGKRRRVTVRRRASRRRPEPAEGRPAERGGAGVGAEKQGCGRGPSDEGGTIAGEKG